MKCPRCWAEKAYIREIPAVKGFFLGLLLLEPMKCHHCYHKFVVPWFSTWGKTVRPPAKRAAPRPETRRSYAAQQLAARRNDGARQPRAGARG